MTINVLRCFNSLNFKISCVFDRRKASHAWKRHYRVSKWWLHFHFCMKYHFKNYRWRSHNTCALRFSETSRESNVCVSVNSLAWHNVAHPRSWLGSSCPLLANTDRWCLSEGSVASCHASGAGQKATETINDKPIRVASFNYVHRLNQSECCPLSLTLPDSIKLSCHYSTYRLPMQVPNLNSLHIFLQQKWRWQKTTLKSANANLPNLFSKRKLEIFCEWYILFIYFLLSNF